MLAIHFQVNNDISRIHSNAVDMNRKVAHEGGLRAQRLPLGACRKKADRDLVQNPKRHCEKKKGVESEGDRTSMEIPKSFN